LGHPEGPFDLEELAGADHEPGGDRAAVGAGGQLGDVALNPGPCPGFLFKFAFHALGAAGQLDEPVPLNRSLSGDGLLGYLDLLVDAVQGPSGSGRGGTGRRSPCPAGRCEIFRFPLVEVG
jgi:hypothetical protein